MQKYLHYNCIKLGNINNLQIQEISRKKLKKNLLRIQVHAIGLNYVDVLMIKGKYQHKKNAPFIPGIEACGIIIEENCNDKKLIGKKVIINTKGGCFSEEAIVSLNEIIIIPTQLDSALAAGAFVPTLTSYIALKEVGKLKKKDSLLITGASGGIGTAAIQLADSLGANITSIVSNSIKKNFLNKILPHKILLIQSKELQNIKKYKDKYKISIILDINGLIKSKNILRFLGWKGKYIIIGFMDNNFFNIPTNYILMKGLNIYGVRAGEYLNKSKNKIQILKNLIKIIKKQNLKTNCYNLVPFKGLKNNLVKLDTRKSLGKNVVITKYYKK